MNRARFSTVLALFATLAVLAAACGGGDPLAESSDEPTAGSESVAGEEVVSGEDAGASEDAAAGDVGTITVGSTNFTEQLILAEMYRLVLEDAGIQTDTRLNLGNREVVFPALEAGEIDLLPEYIGALSTFLAEGEGGEEAAGLDTEAVYERLEAALPEGLVALEPSEAQDKDALAVTREFAEEHGVETVSDLAGLDMELRLGGPPETETRYVGIPGLQEVYGLEFAAFTALDAGGPLTIRALQDGQIDVGRVFTTQGEIQSENLVVLEDDKDLVPAENIVPIIREEKLNDEVRTLLNDVSAALTEEDLIAMNEQVALEDADPAEVAESFLTEQGLIGG